MKRLHFDYYMEINYSIPVSKCHFTIKCIPVSNQRQTLENIQIELFPETAYEQNKDGFGNIQIYGHEGETHDRFSFHVTGNVKINQILFEEDENENQTMIFRHPYGLNKPGEEILSYFSTFIFETEMTEYEKCLWIMHKLHRDFKYESNRTTVNTTAEEAWSQGRGVCQDYAHIMIALLHLAGIPARYAAGMLTGEGASHAWVEVWCNKKWYGIDPTNDVLVADNHIKICHGRDASDCLINRGLMWGGGEQSQYISVTVEEMI